MRLHCVRELTLEFKVPSSFLNSVESIVPQNSTRVFAEVNLGRCWRSSPPALTNCFLFPNTPYSSANRFAGSLTVNGVLKIAFGGAPPLNRHEEARIILMSLCDQSSGCVSKAGDPQHRDFLLWPFKPTPKQLNNNTTLSINKERPKKPKHTMLFSRFPHKARSPQNICGAR